MKVSGAASGRARARQRHAALRQLGSGDRDRLVHRAVQPPPLGEAAGERVGARIERQPVDQPRRVLVQTRRVLVVDVGRALHLHAVGDVAPLVRGRRDLVDLVVAQRHGLRDRRVLRRGRTARAGVDVVHERRRNDLEARDDSLIGVGQAAGDRELGELGARLRGGCGIPFHGPRRTRDVHRLGQVVVDAQGALHAEIARQALHVDEREAGVVAARAGGAELEVDHGIRVERHRLRDRRGRRPSTPRTSWSRCRRPSPSSRRWS